MKSQVLCVLLLFTTVWIFGCTGNQVTAPDTQLALASPGLEQVATQNPGVIPPNANPYGKSYAEWSIDWWQWLASAPLDQNPGLDETGEFVDWGQSGPVWFLAPNFGGVSVRDAIVPPGTALFIDVTAFETSTREGHGTTEEELRGTAAYVVGLMENLSCEIDGVAVEMLEAYRTQSSEMFSLTVPDDNVFDLWGVPTDAGTYYPSVADGYYVMVAPLSVGNHTIHLHGEIPDFEYVTDVTFHLTVINRGGRQTIAD